MNVHGGLIARCSGGGGEVYHYHIPTTLGIFVNLLLLSSPFVFIYKHQKGPAITVHSRISVCCNHSIKKHSTFVVCLCKKRLSDIDLFDLKV